MSPISFKRHRFPSDVIRYAVWLYFRCTKSFRDVEELLTQRGIEVSYETILCWTIKFGPQIAENLRKRRPSPSPRWHLDEMVCKIGGRRMYLWRAVVLSVQRQLFSSWPQRPRPAPGFSP